MQYENKRKEKKWMYNGRTFWRKKAKIRILPQITCTLRPVLILVLANINTCMLYKETKIRAKFNLSHSTKLINHTDGNNTIQRTNKQKKNKY
jgi:hypothetical protein